MALPTDEQRPLVHYVGQPHRVRTRRGNKPTLGAKRRANRRASPKELTAFRVEEDVMVGLRAVKARNFIPLSVQVAPPPMVFPGHHGWMA
jgi:hypothetical protein